MTTALYTHPVCKLHKMGESNIECPARIQAIEDRLAEDGIDRHLEFRLAPEATVDDLKRVHLLDTIEWVRNNTPKAADEYVGIHDMLLNKYSWEAALRAAGAAIAATDAVLDGEIENAHPGLAAHGCHEGQAEQGDGDQRDAEGGAGIQPLVHALSPVFSPNRPLGLNISTTISTMKAKMSW